MSAKEFKKHFAKNTLSMVTSAFGLVAALAWNEVITEVVEKFIKPALGASSGLISLIFYALVVTFLAVVVTYNLSKLAEK
jgi:large-conductance mechanosensitive channel